VVQKDDGQTVTVAQRDDGDVQLGDRVQIVQDRSGVAKAVRDNARQPDYQNNPPQTYTPAPQAGNYGGGYGRGGYQSGSYQSGGYPSGGYQSGGYQSGGQSGSYDFGSGPQPADYGQPQRYAPPQSSSRSGYQSGYGSGSGGFYQTGGYGNGPQPQNDPRYGTLQ
jgi:hypothetical protein